MVAIQGIKGSFHHQVAQHYFGENIEVVECLSFDAAVETLLANSANVMVMAIENSIAGSIIPNYALLHTYNLNIIGEYYLNVQHHLMALPGQNISDISEVHSHPMALQQCKLFFKAYPHITLVEAKDTADVAKLIYKKQLKGIAAIASSTAAQLYHLTILAKSIQTVSHNETRFVIVQKDKKIIEHSNKASLRLQLSHKRGSLAEVLAIMRDNDLSLTKIQSLPIIQTPWSYAFFIDVTFTNTQHYNTALQRITTIAEHLKVLGQYENAQL